MRKFMGVFLSVFVVIGILCGNISVNAEMPPGTAVVGDKAYDLNYLMKPTAEDNKYIFNHIVQGKEIYIKNFAGQWVKNSDNSKVKNIENILPEVAYKNIDGKEVTYDEGDGDIIDGNEFYVVGIY